MLKRTFQNSFFGLQILWILFLVLADYQTAREDATHSFAPEAFFHLGGYLCILTVLVILFLLMWKGYQIAWSILSIGYLFLAIYAVDALRDFISVQNWIHLLISVVGILAFYLFPPILFSGEPPSRMQVFLFDGYVGVIASLHCYFVIRTIAVSGASSARKGCMIMLLGGLLLFTLLVLTHRTIRKVKMLFLLQLASALPLDMDFFLPVLLSLLLSAGLYFYTRSPFYRVTMTARNNRK